MSQVRHTLVQRSALALLWVYKTVVSPWLPPSCRFIPSCSDYARQAIEKYGAIRGSRKAAARLCRCHPLHGGGVDLLD